MYKVPPSIAKDIDPNDQDDKESYMLTLTYKNSPGFTPEYQFFNTIFPIVNKLNKACSYYYLSPELTLAGEIHYHAIFQIKDKISWYKNCLPSFKRNGFVYVKKIFDYEKAMEYIKKDVTIWDDIIPMITFPIYSKDHVAMKMLSKKYIDKYMNEFVYKYHKSIVDYFIERTYK